MARAGFHHRANRFRVQIDGRGFAFQNARLFHERQAKRRQHLRAPLDETCEIAHHRRVGRVALQHDLKRLHPGLNRCERIAQIVNHAANGPIQNLKHRLGALAFALLAQFFFFE